MYPSFNTEETQLIEQALQCLEVRFQYNSEHLANSNAVSSYLRLHLAAEKNEVFAALFLDNRNCLLSFEKMFFGTINEATVYPRAVVQKALEINAASVIFAHNHPSGNASPSTTDKETTSRLKKSLALFDIKVLDHFIVTAQETVSFATEGLL